MCVDGTVDEFELMDMVGSLVDKSMVIADRGEPAVRYRLLETLRQYGEERLHERADTTATRDRHLAHYVDLAQRAHQLWASRRQLDADAIVEQEWDNLRAADNWAVATANLDAADALVAAIGPHAWCRGRHEHGDWATRALTLDTVNRHLNPTTYGWAAYWTYLGDDYDRAIALALHGVDVAPAPEDPDTTWCWTVLAWTYLAAGGGTQVHESARHAQAAASLNPDLLERALAHMPLIESAFDSKDAGVGGLVGRYVSLADRIGAPSLRARAALYQGDLKLRAEASRDAQGALASYGKGLDLARATGDINNENLMLWAAVSAATWLQTAEANDVCREALTRLYDTRYWLLVWRTVDSVAGWLTATGNIEAGAIIYGHLDAHHPAHGEAGARRRSCALRVVRQHPRAEQFMALGAAKDRDQLVAFVLDQLADPTSA